MAHLYQEGKQVFDFDDSLVLGSHYKPPAPMTSSPYYGSPEDRIPKQRPYVYPTSKRNQPHTTYHQSVVAHKQSRQQAAAMVEAESNKCRCTRGLIIGLSIAGVVVLAAVIVTTLALTGVIFNYQPKPDLFPTTPPMGWRSSGAFFCDRLSQTLIQSTASAIVSLGYRDAGYTLVIIDDCWQAKRNSSGVLTPDSSKFPAGNIGMRNLARELQAQQLSIGFTTSVGSLSCQRRPGGHQLQDRDRRIYDDWKAEYVHGEDCFIHPATTRQQAYAELARELATLTNRAVHSVTSKAGVAAADGHAHIVQFRNYIIDDWYEMLAVIDQVLANNDTRRSRPGFWVDIGPMPAGLGGMSHLQYIAQFGLWCALKSPLIMGNDMSIATAPLLRSLLQHDEMVAVNQDALGAPAVLVSRTPVSPLSRQKNNMVVTAPCSPGDPAQEWEIDYINDADHRLFRNPVRDMCLGWEPDDTASVRLCFASDAFIRWSATSPENQLHPLYSSDDCLTTSTTPRVAARLRACAQRESTRDWQGPNKWWHGFNDVMWIEAVDNETQPIKYTMKNNNNQCLTVGLNEYWDIFSGPLSDDRFVVLLLNRDYESHTMRFSWTDIPGMDPARVYYVRDVYDRRDFGGHSTEFSWRVDGHSSLMLVMRPAF